MRWAAIIFFAASITAAGQCSYSISPPEINIGSLDFINTIRVYASPGCAWTAQSLNSDWIQIFNGGTGIGDGQFAIRVLENNSPQARSGGIRVANQTMIVNQSAASCNYVLTPPSTRVGTSSGIGTFFINSRCSWTAQSDSSWLRLTGPGSSGITNGIGNGAVVYEYERNTSTASRNARITIAPGVSFSLNQDGTLCEVTFATSVMAFGPGGGTDYVNVRSGCTWSAKPDVSWIRIEDTVSPFFAQGAGNGRFRFSVSSNPAISQRTGTITVGDKVFTVTQGGGGCTYSTTPAFVNLPVNGGDASFRINTQEGCIWTAIPNEAWLSVIPGSGSGPTTLTVSATYNNSGTQRQAVLTILGISFGVVQSADPAPTIYAVLNAASQEPVAVSPGQIVTIRGARMGPATSVDAVPDFGSFLMPTQVSGTSVTFDGIPAPVISTQDSVLRVVAPYGLVERQKAEVQVTYQGRKSDVFNVPVAPVSPAVFTLNESGKGPALARTEDYNFSDTSNPIRLGTEMILYATGEGLSNPAGIDGRIIGETITRPREVVRVFVAGRQLETTYIGGAPGQVSGWLQINARIPYDFPVGDDLPVLVYVGEVPSQSGVTVSIRQ